MGSNIKISWNQRAIEKAAEEAGRKAMKIASDAASTVRCLDHGQIVRIVERKPRTGEFTFAACCAAAKQTAQEAVQRALS